MSDIAFLCKQTKLPCDKLLSLLEEDFIHVLDAISLNTIDEPISFELFTKLTILRETKDVDFPLVEKAYVANCITSQYPKVHNKSHYLIDQKTLGEAEGQYYLVLTGMFPEFLISKYLKGAPQLQFYVNVAKDAFSRSNINIHVDDWVDLLYYIKTHCWK